MEIRYCEENWQKFVDKCVSCTRCPLCESRKNVVIYRGKVPAPLMIIGEGPGKNEDEEGRPFVGRSGKLLDLALTAFGISEEHYHIANIVKCRPPQNRVPTLEEVRACRPLLQWQFALNKPCYVLLMGATAYRYFTGDDKCKISQVRGKFIEREGTKIMATFHPAYVLRDPRKKADLWQDIETLRNSMQSDGLIL